MSCMFSQTQATSMIFFLETCVGNQNSTTGEWLFEYIRNPRPPKRLYSWWPLLRWGSRWLHTSWANSCVCAADRRRQRQRSGIWDQHSPGPADRRAAHGALDTRWGGAFMWKGGQLFPLWKGFGSKRDPTKYRGIVLLNVLGKRACLPAQNGDSHCWLA